MSEKMIPLSLVLKILRDLLLHLRRSSSSSATASPGVTMLSVWTCLVELRQTAASSSSARV